MSEIPTSPSQDDSNPLPKMAMSVNWYPWEVNLLKRAKGRCEYCDKDMFASSDIYYHDRHWDHIVPDAGNDLNNLAVACKACNFIKSDKRFPGATTREEIIAEARLHIQEARARNQVRMTIDRKWFDRQL